MNSLEENISMNSGKIQTLLIATNRMMFQVAELLQKREIIQAISKHFTENLFRAYFDIYHNEQYITWTE